MPRNSYAVRASPIDAGFVAGSVAKQVRNVQLNVEITPCMKQRITAVATALEISIAESLMRGRRKHRMAACGIPAKVQGERQMYVDLRSTIGCKARAG